MSARPVVQVFAANNASEKVANVKLPGVFSAPVRHDIVHFVHTGIAKNRRQAYAISAESGHQVSAISWGTGRAVSRIPRVNGSGTHRAGQGAYGNMCRGGRMFAPTKTWRKWHVKVPLKQRRAAVVAAIAASAMTPLVMARGHRVQNVAEIPLVISDDVESITKTKEAVAILKAHGAYADVEKVKASRKIRRGKGKLRNRRYVQKVGPLVVYNNDKGLTKAFRNIPGVQLQNVERLNLLELAPGGHLGRFIIWTQSAFERLNDIYGSSTSAPTMKKNFRIAHSMIANSDITRVINSDEIQSALRAKVTTINRRQQKKNPLKNLSTMVRLNPYAMAHKRAALKHAESAGKRKAAKAAYRKTPAARALEKKRKAASKAFFKSMTSDRS